ncbi:MAG: metal-dependent hydrolase [Pseudobacteriovorax sp.]|nr:metal-dependent hydrolase [Pseudobacteriovorax sp.]
MHADDIKIDFDGCPVVWNRSNFMVSCFLDSLSLIIPRGEQVFMDSVQKASENSDNQGLSEDLKIFIQQEANHSKAHLDYNNWLFKNFDFVHRHEKFYDRFLKTFIYGSTKHQLACTVALEYLTYGFSRIILGDRMLNDAHPAIRRFWTWHAIEEIEHKGIAFRVAEEAKLSYIRRCLTMLWVLPPLAILLAYGMIGLLRDNKSFNLTSIRLGIKFFFTEAKFIPRLIPILGCFFIPLFKPDHLSDDHIMPDQAKKEEITSGSGSEDSPSHLRLVG